jgi:hypothetical protein
VIFYFTADGGLVMRREPRTLFDRDERLLEHGSARIIEVCADGSVIVHKDRYGSAREILAALPGVSP